LSPLVEVLVSDTGPGVAAALMPFIFDRFRQGSTGPPRPLGGLGLGLAIVRQLAELHGGSVECRNNVPPPGATFRVLLPLGALNRHGSARMSGAAAAQGPGRLDGLGILVVDDDPHERELFASTLEHAGAEVRAATNADDALFLMQTWSPAVAVTSVDTAADDGYALLRRLASLPEPRPVAVAVTADEGLEHRTRVLDAGFQAHLVKPVDPKELVTVIVTVLSAAPAGEPR
jgi:CheY-like chemotaxis protein